MTKSLREVALAWLGNRQVIDLHMGSDDVMVNIVTTRDSRGESEPRLTVVRHRSGIRHILQFVAFATGVIELVYSAEIPSVAGTQLVTITDYRSIVSPGGLTNWKWRKELEWVIKLLESTHLRPLSGRTSEDEGEVAHVG